MSQAQQPQPVFVDIHLRNGQHIGFPMFTNILNGRFNGDKQLAFEQYLADLAIYGTAYRTYRYLIVNGNTLLLHRVFNSSPAGPALAAPVTQPGPQYANAQTQASGYQTPYASHLNQPVANLLGPVNPSAMQNMSYPPAKTAQGSVPHPRRLNPHAPEFTVGSAVNKLGASARLSALPTADSAPARPPGLPITQQPQFAPSNAHRGFLAPDAMWQLSHYNGEAARAAAESPVLTTPYSLPIHSHGQAVPQKPQLTPFNARQGHCMPDTLLRSFDDHREAAGAPARPPVLATNIVTAARDSWMASPSPLDLAAVSSSEIDNLYLSPRQWSRRTSEHSSDAPSHSSSVQDRSPSPWCLYHGYRCPLLVDSVFSDNNWSSYHTANNSVSKAYTTNNTSHGPQHGEADTGVAPVLPPPPPQLQPRYGPDTTGEYRIRQNLRPSTAISDKLPSWDPISEYISGQHHALYDVYKRWQRSAPHDASLSDFFDYLKSLPEGLRWYQNRFGLRHPQGPVTTPSPWSSSLPSGTVSHHTKSPRVGYGMDTSRQVAEFDTSAPRTPKRNGSDISSRKWHTPSYLTMFSAPLWRRK